MLFKLLSLYAPIRGLVSDCREQFQLRSGRGRLAQESRHIQQNAFVFSPTGYRNIVDGILDPWPQEVERAARNANVDDFIRQLPDGHRTVLEELCRNFHGAEKQCISAALTVLQNVPTLLLDEAT
ncbi:hypothetical protein LLF88_06870 [bacterium]|nr:hypothetical protein [bacterium]